MHNWLNQSSWNKCWHAAKIITNMLIYMNEVLHYQFVHRKISTLTFGTNLIQWMWNTSNPSSPTQGARYVYSWHRNCVCVCTCACAWILRHISVKRVCAHLMSITSLMVKLKKHVSDTFHSVHSNYKLQDIQFATGMQKLNWKSRSGWPRTSHRFCVWNSTTKIVANVSEDCMAVSLF